MNDVAVDSGASFDLAAWRRDPDALRPFFDDAEIEALDAARRRVDSRGTVVYCVYENPFAKSGGIFPVTDNYCSTLAQRGRSVLVMTPYHSKLRTAPSGQDVVPAGRCQATFGGRAVSVDLYEHTRRGVRWILLRADGYFEAGGGPGRTDPYSDADSQRLLTDSLFLCAAIPPALAALGLRDNLVLHLQDWELAASALTAKLAVLDGTLSSAAVVLTSHNPYDRGLPAEALRLITSRRYRGPQPPETMYQCMLPLTDGPISTVSRTFAQELTTDPLQTKYFAEHLQDVFRTQGVVGVDNGFFGDDRPAFSEQAIRRAAAGDSEPILAEKAENRRRMLEALSAYHDPRILGGLDGGEEGGRRRPLAELDDSVPLFLMFGRLDPGQKGFDVLARSIERLPRGAARFMLTPDPQGSPPELLADLQELADKFAGEVAVYPFRMQQGYVEAMAGATFVVLPSLYEPFGGATEPYLAGTPVVARATGGLIQQVTDIDADQEQGTGLLYREKLTELAALGDQWKKVQRQVEHLGERMEVPVYQEMVTACVAALDRACEIHRHEPELYGRMLAHLHHKARQFSWETTMRAYQAIYNAAVDG